MKLISQSNISLEDTESLEKKVTEICFCKCENLPTLAALTDRYIQFVSNRVNYHQGMAAKILGISRRTLYRKTTSHC